MTRLRAALRKNAHDRPPTIPNKEVGGLGRCKVGAALYYRGDVE